MEIEATAEEFIDAGDRVVVSAYFKGRGRGSGIEVAARFYDVYTLRDGKVVPAWTSSQSGPTPPRGRRAVADQQLFGLSA